MAALSQVPALESHPKRLVLSLLFFQPHLQGFVGMLTLFFYLVQLRRKRSLGSQASTLVLSLVDPAFVEFGLQGKALILPVSISPASMAQMEAALELVTLLRTFHAIQIFIEIDVPLASISVLLTCSLLALAFDPMLIYRQHWTLWFMWYFLYRNLSLAVLQLHTRRYVLPRVQFYALLCQLQRDLVHRFLAPAHLIIEIITIFHSQNRMEVNDPE